MVSMKEISGRNRITGSVVRGPDLRQYGGRYYITARIRGVSARLRMLYYSYGMSYGTQMMNKVHRIYPGRRVIIRAGLHRGMDRNKLR